MTDKQQIEEMKDEICKILLINGEYSLKDALYYREEGIHIISEALYNAGYRKVGENADLKLKNKIYKRALELSVAHQVVFVRSLLIDCYLRQARAETEQEEQNDR